MTGTTSPTTMTTTVITTAERWSPAAATTTVHGPGASTSTTVLPSVPEDACPGRVSQSQPDLRLRRPGPHGLDGGGPTDSLLGSRVALPSLAGATGAPVDGEDQIDDMVQNESVGVDPLSTSGIEGSRGDATEGAAAAGHTRGLYKALKNQTKAKAKIKAKSASKWTVRAPLIGKRRGSVPGTNLEGGAAPSDRPSVEVSAGAAGTSGSGVSGDTLSHLSPAERLGVHRLSSASARTGLGASGRPLSSAQSSSGAVSPLVPPSATSSSTRNGRRSDSPARRPGNVSGRNTGVSLHSFLSLDRPPMMPASQAAGQDELRLFRMAAEYNGSGDPPEEALEAWMMHSLSVLPYAYPASYPINKSRAGRGASPASTTSPASPVLSPGVGAAAGTGTSEWTEWGGYEDRVLDRPRHGPRSGQSGPSSALVPSASPDASTPGSGGVSPSWREMGPSTSSATTSPTAPTAGQGTSSRSRLSLDSYRPSASHFGLGLGLQVGLGVGAGVGRPSLHASATASGTSLPGTTPPRTPITSPLTQSITSENDGPSRSPLAPAAATRSGGGIRRQGDGRGRPPDPKNTNGAATGPGSGMSSRPFQKLLEWTGVRRASAPDTVKDHADRAENGQEEEELEVHHDDVPPASPPPLTAANHSRSTTTAPTITLSSNSNPSPTATTFDAVETSVTSHSHCHIARVPSTLSAPSSPTDAPPAYDQVVN